MTIHTETMRGDIIRTTVMAIRLRGTTITTNSEMRRGDITIAIRIREFVMATNTGTMKDIQVTIIIRQRDIVSMTGDTMKKDVMIGLMRIIN